MILKFFLITNLPINQTSKNEIDAKKIINKVFFNPKNNSITKNSFMSPKPMLSNEGLFCIFSVKNLHTSIKTIKIKLPIILGIT